MRRRFFPGVPAVPFVLRDEATSKTFRAPACLIA